MSHQRPGRRLPRRAPGNLEAATHGLAPQAPPATPAAHTIAVLGTGIRGTGHTTRSDNVELAARRGRNGMRTHGRPMAGAPLDDGAVTGRVGTRDRARDQARGRTQGVARGPSLLVRSDLPRGATSPPDGLDRVLGPRLSRTGRISHLRGGRDQGSLVRVRRLPLASSSSRSSGSPSAGPNSGSSGGDNVRFPLLATVPTTLCLFMTRPWHSSKSFHWKTSCGSGRSAPRGTLHRLTEAAAVRGGRGPAGRTTGLRKGA